MNHCIAVKSVITGLILYLAVLPITIISSAGTPTCHQALSSFSIKNLYNFFFVLFF